MHLALQRPSVAPLHLQSASNSSARPDKLTGPGAVQNALHGEDDREHRSLPQQRCVRLLVATLL